MKETYTQAVHPLEVQGKMFLEDCAVAEGSGMLTTVGCCVLYLSLSNVSHMFIITWFSTTKDSFSKEVFQRLCDLEGSSGIGLIGLGYASMCVKDYITGRNFMERGAKLSSGFDVWIHSHSMPFCDRITIPTPTFSWLAVLVTTASMSPWLCLSWDKCKDRWVTPYCSSTTQDNLPTFVVCSHLRTVRPCLQDTSSPTSHSSLPTCQDSSPMSQECVSCLTFSFFTPSYFELFLARFELWCYGLTFFNLCFPGLGYITCLNGKSRRDNIQTLLRWYTRHRLALFRVVFCHKCGHSHWMMCSSLHTLSCQHLHDKHDPLTLRF